VGLLFPVGIRRQWHRRDRDIRWQTGSDILGKEAALTAKRAATAGFSLIELLVVIAIGSVLVGIAIPITINALRSYRLTAAVSAATGAIESTRYAEIMHAYPGNGSPGYGYEITFTPETNSYQVYAMIPPATTYTPVGTPVPISGPGDVTISRPVTYQFSAGGTVTETSNPVNMSFQVAIINPATGLPYTTAGWSNTITVSGVGYVSVSTP
jgi:prepilin-type N-terminal cleavage/methylation domain-containing protein